MNKNPFSSATSVLPAELHSPHVPASARVYSELRNRIVGLELPPDTTLVRNELAEKFGVSQSPVREAIMRLEQDGLVVAYPQSRTVVTRIDVARIREEHFLRTAVECDVVRQLAKNPDEATIRKAGGLLKMQEALVGDVDQIELFKQLDEVFHEALFAGVGQANLHQHITARSGNLARLRSLDLPRTGKMKSVLEGHRAVLEAVEAGKPAKAMETMREHLSGTVDRMGQIIRDNQELFV